MENFAQILSNLPKSYLKYYQKLPKPKLSKIWAKVIRFGQNQNLAFPKTSEFLYGYGMLYINFIICISL